MTFQIVRRYPIHCPIRDGIIGFGFSRLPNAYETQACALAIAARLSADDYNQGGDDSFVVTTWGGDLYKNRVLPPLADYPIPF